MGYCLAGLLVLLGQRFLHFCVLFAVFFPCLREVTGSSFELPGGESHRCCLSLQAALLQQAGPHGSASTPGWWRLFLFHGSFCWRWDLGFEGSCFGFTTVATCKDCISQNFPKNFEMNFVNFASSKKSKRVPGVRPLCADVDRPVLSPPPQPQRRAQQQHQGSPMNGRRKRHQCGPHVSWQLFICH